MIPSKLFEGMGIPALQGVAGESADIVEREGVGLVFEPENAGELCEGLSRLEHDRALYEDLRARCLTAAPKYQRSVLANQMLALLKVRCGASDPQRYRGSMRSRGVGDENH